MRNRLSQPDSQPDPARGASRRPDVRRVSETILETINRASGRVAREILGDLKILAAGGRLERPILRGLPTRIATNVAKGVLEVLQRKGDLRQQN